MTELERRKAALEKLEAKEAEAKAVAGKASAEAAKARRQLKAMEREEAKRKEQADALAFYRKFGGRDMAEVNMWLCIIEEAKIQVMDVPGPDGNPVKKTAYDWLKGCYVKRLKRNGIGGGASV